MQPFSDINKTLKKQISMQIDIVTNKEIARRLKISESKACGWYGCIAMRILCPNTRLSSG